MTLPLPVLRAMAILHFTPRAAYAAMITRMDRYVEMINLVEKLNLTNDTIVIFSSDNGTTHLKPKLIMTFSTVSGNCGLKSSLYEGGIRFPYW